jgi:hypothetical protein
VAQRGFVRVLADQESADDGGLRSYLEQFRPIVRWRKMKGSATIRLPNGIER